MRQSILISAILLFAVSALAQTAPKTKPAKVPVKASSGPLSSQQAEEILSELRQIRVLLEIQGNRQQQQLPTQQTILQPGLQPGQPVRIKVGTDRVLGKPDAPVTIVEYADYQCAFCKLFHTSTFPQLKRDFIDSGKVRFVSRDLPLDMHEDAASAAEAARCAGEQGKFWEMRDALIANAPNLKDPDVNRYAVQLGVNIADFRSCLDTRRFKAEVKADASMAEALNISATPSFVIGRSTADGVEGDIQLGVISQEKFKQEIERAGGKQ